MNCCQCQAIEEVFDHSLVSKELRTYRRKGLKKETRILADALAAQRIAGCSLIDVGGGFGALSLELIKKGVSRATLVEASSAYLEAAKLEAVRQGYEDRLTNVAGNFVDRAGSLPAADLVTLDKVICCYDDMPGLVSASAKKANKLYGVIYPRDRWWVKAVAWLVNRYAALRGSGYRSFVYPTREVDRRIRENGLRPIFYKALIDWQIILYARSGVAVAPVE